MRKFLFACVAMVILTGVAALAMQQPQREVSVTIYFGAQHRATLEKSVPFAEGMNAMDAVRRAARVETNREGTFLNSIEGVANSSETKEYWLFFVNGEAQHTGAAERKLVAGDRVLWFLRRQGPPGGHSN